jgi:RNA polymerase sigma factor (sigma-70 family)
LTREAFILTDKLIAEISACIRSVLARKFPEMSLPQREDVEQNVMIKLCRMARDGKKIDHLTSYLWRVVTTTALDWLEAAGGTVSLEECLEKGGFHGLPEGILVASDEDAFEARRGLEDLLASLPEKRRLVVKLQMAGWDIEESAAWLGWTPAKVRHLLYRGLGQMKKMRREAREKENEGKESGLPVAGRVREGLPD